MPEYTVHPRDMLIKIFPVDKFINGTVKAENGTVNDTVKESINEEKEPINEGKEPINDEKDSINEEKEPINEEKEPINDEKGTVNDTINLNEDEKLVVELLWKDGTVSYDVLVLHTHFSRSKITRLIKGLKEKKVIEYVGSKKTGFWKIM